MTRALRVPSVGVGLFLVAILAASPVLAAGGFLDPTFSGDGIVRLGPPETGVASVERADVRVGPGGRPFVHEGVRNTDGESAAGYLRVRSASGRVLSAYVGNGTILMGRTAEGFVHSLGMFPLAGGGIVYGVVRIDIGEPSPYVAERSADGNLVTSAGIPGVKVAPETYVSPITRLPGGSIRGCSRVVPGAGPDEVRLVGLTPALTADSRLGPSNYAVIAVDCRTVASDPAGRTYVLGATTVSGAAAVSISAYDAYGSLITTWGSAGHQTIALAGSDVGFGQGQIVAGADGSMMIPGEVQSTTAGSKPVAAILSLGAGGVPNAAFSGDGIATFSPFGGRSSLWAMDLDSSGRPIVSLVSWLDDGHVKAVLARVTTSGTIDATFGHSGFVTLKRAVRDLDVDAMNRIVSVAIDGNVVVLTRRT